MTAHRRIAICHNCSPRILLLYHSLRATTSVVTNEFLIVDFIRKYNQAKFLTNLNRSQFFDAEANHLYTLKNYMSMCHYLSHKYRIPNV